MRTSVLSFAMALVAPMPVLAQSPSAEAAAPRAEVLMLGVYHMANPGTSSR